MNKRIPYKVKQTTKWGGEVIVIISIACKSKNLAKILNEKEKKENLQASIHNRIIIPINSYAQTKQNKKLNRNLFEAETMGYEIQNGTDNNRR